MRLRSLLILSAYVVILYSCGTKGGKTGLMVPDDASIVVHVNSKSLSSKLSWEEIRQTNWFGEISKEAKDSMALQLLKDPANSGIDTEGDLVFYMKKQGPGGYMVFQGSLSDPAAFEKFLKELKKRDPATEVKKDGDFSYISSNDGVVIWNNSKFSFVGNSPMPNMSELMNRRQMGMQSRHEFPADSLRLFGRQALTLAASDNLDKDKRFADLVSDGADAHLWANADGYYGNMSMMMPLANVGSLLKGSVSGSSLNFENGKITVKSKAWYGEEMTRLLDKYEGKSLSTDMINRIPSPHVDAVFAFNYPPEAIQAFLKAAGADGLVNGYLSQMNYSIEEFVKAFKGDALLAITDLTLAGKADTLMIDGDQPFIRNRTRPDMNVLVAATVNDKAAFDKLMGIVANASKQSGGKIPAINYKVQGEWFAASNSADGADKFLAGGNNKFAFVNKISGHPFGMYIDIQKIIQTTHTAVDSSGQAAADTHLKMWQDAVAYGGDFKDKALHYTFEVNLVDKNTNSLKQLNQYMDKLSTFTRKHRKLPVIVDSMIVAPPPAAEGN